MGGVEVNISKGDIKYTISAHIYDIISSKVMIDIPLYRYMFIKYISTYNNA